MTDEELDAIETKAKATIDAVGAESSLQADCAYIEATRPRRILNLIADLRQAREELQQVLTERKDLENRYKDAMQYLFNIGAIVRRATCLTKNF